MERTRIAIPRIGLLATLLLCGALFGSFALSCFAQGAGAADSLDCGKAAGDRIAAYRDSCVPNVFASPDYWYYVDAAVLALSLFSGASLVWRDRSERWITLHLLIAFLYFGLFRGGCLCPVGAIGNVSYAIVEPEKVGRAEFLLFLLPLLASLVMGRVFCGTLCPVGAVQRLVSPRLAKPLPRLLHLALLAIPVFVLLATVFGAVLGSYSLACRLDPYKPVFFQGYLILQQLGAFLSGKNIEAVLLLVGGFLSWALLSAALALGWLVPRVFCRYVCPYGVLLGTLSLLSLRKRKIDERACKACRQCIRRCPVQAISCGPTGAIAISSYQCIQCGRCSDLCSVGAVKPRA